MKNIKQGLKNLLIPLLLIVIAQGIDYRWDVTQDQRYTLNDNTKILLTELEQPLKIDIFLTTPSWALTPEILSIYGMQ